MVRQLEDFQPQKSVVDCPFDKSCTSTMAQQSKLCKIIFGTTELGSNVDKEISRRMLHDFITRHFPTESVYLDTSSVYGRGESEKSLSMIHALNIPTAQRHNIQVSTKVHALRGLDKRGVHQQFATSLERMSVDKVDILYIHQPSTQYPILPTLEAINELYEEGKIQLFGLCNFPSWMVCDVVHLCRKHGFRGTLGLSRCVSVC